MNKQNNSVDSILQALEARQYRLAEKLATELLGTNSLAPQGWVCLGEALLMQGCGRAARRAFDRGWLLDPQALWVNAVRSALAQVPNGPARPEVDKLLAVKPVTVAAAIITFNEARSIERCVQSLIDAVDEIVIIDSASTDGTLELAQHLPKVKVIRNVQWNDDFAAQRNSGLDYIESEWVLFVDADEWLFEEDIATVREAAALFDTLPDPAVLNICQVNYIQGKESRDYSIPRMFATNKGLHYYGRIHEQVIAKGKGMYDGGVFRHSVRIRLHHDGYEPAHMQRHKKLDRNLNLLRRMVEDEPDNPGWLLYYGREMLGTGDVDKSLGILLEAERKARTTPGFGRLPDILIFLNKIYMSKKDYDQAESACRRALESAPDFPDALFHLAQAQMRKAAALLQEAERNLSQSKASFQSYRGIVDADRSILDWKADLSLADLTRISGKQAEAKAMYEKILEKHPGLGSVRKKLER